MQHIVDGVDGPDSPISMTSTLVDDLDDPPAALDDLPAALLDDPPAAHVAPLGSAVPISVRLDFSAIPGLREAYNDEVARVEELLPVGTFLFNDPFLITLTFVGFLLSLV